MGKSAYKKMERLQEKLARTTGTDTKINPLTAGWVFEKWYEKIILWILIGLGVWKLGGLIF